MSPHTNSDSTAHDHAAPTPAAVEGAAADTPAASPAAAATADKSPAEPSHPQDDGLTFTAGLPAEELHRRALAARRLQGRTQHLLAQLLLEMEQRQLYCRFGCSSVFMYAALHLGLEGHTVAEYLRTGRSLRAFPLLAAAYREGSISACKVREITRVATSETEAYWLEVARTHSYRQIEKMVVFSPRQKGPPRREEPGRSGGVVIPPLLTGDSLMRHDTAHHQAVPQAGLSPAGLPDVALSTIALSPARLPETGEQQTALPGAGLSEAGEPHANPPRNPAAPGASSGPALQALFPGFNGGGLQQSPPDPTAGSYHALQCRETSRCLPDHGPSESITCACKGEVTPPVQGHYEPDARKYLEKMVLELSAEQAAVIHDALRQARKESGAGDRASLLAYMARKFLDNARGSPGEISKKPPYQVVIHHHPGSGAAWTESARGPVYMPQAAFDRALCDAELVDMPAMSAHEHGMPEAEREKSAVVTKEAPAPGGGDEQPGTAMEQVNKLYRAYRNRGRRKAREDAETGRDGGKKRRGRTGTIPPAMRKKVLLRDGGRCQVPGCGRSHHVEVHHLTPWGAGGDHVPEGLLVLCSGCHKNVHEGRLSIEGRAPDRLVVRRV